jgi:hypothetical protein
MMAWLVAGVNLLLLAASGLAAPAPTEVGTWELVLAAALALTVVIVAAGILTGRARVLHREQLVALLVIPLLGLPVVLSVIVGVLRGIPFDAALRSALPYTAFLPVALLGLVVGGRARLAVVTGPLVVVGVAHAAYLLGLFLVRVPDPTDTRTVFLARITLIEPRTTLPLLFGAALLPMAAVATARRRVSRILWAVPIAMAVAAALSTQTRSQLVALVGGAGAFAALHAVWRARQRGRSWSLGLVRGAIAGILGTAVAVGILYLIPHTRSLLEALVLRSRTEADTGRIADEWIPALNSVIDDGLSGVFGGIGAGQSFITAGGEERTYVHNLLLYGLVYFGAPGLALMLLAYAVLLVGLWRRALASADRRYLALAALVVALLVYAQFFAVHKLFSYNLMLMLAVQALVQPPGQPAGSG